MDEVDVVDAMNEAVVLEEEYVYFLFMRDLKLIAHSDWPRTRRWAVTISAEAIAPTVKFLVTLQILWI